MDEDSKFGGLVKWGLGAIGLSAVASAVVMPNRYGLMIALAILLLGLLLFGGYFLWQRRRARRQREQFIGDIEKQTSAAPRVISDPKKRADLDRVRGKFQTGLQEFKSRGKDIYKLPWYVIIGESGSGKTEAIRHSEIDFPPGLNKEHQGTGGTVNMDWWFTNRGVILDTAGSMVFPEAGAGEAPEWQEFLRLLKKARPQCPINGLFLVLSIESLIRDSADKISQKASRLAQHLDLIQRTLDVRFPVYLLVTKSDLLTGFREFFDSIEDPLLQHQMFGWSNPDPLDAPFRPDLVDQHLGNVAERVRRRRLALLRESSTVGRIGDTQHFFAASYQLGRGPAGARRLDEVDAMFALPESIMRLAPRLRRYLETVFVAGEWSAKPVFLRGIYFTSSMREGKALDEAIAFATGLALDQLPDDRTWDKNRAFFLRDLFHEKVFRESGLVTRATNTLKLLRQRQMAIFGTAGVALLLFLVVVLFARNSLQKSVGKEVAYWKAGAANWKENAPNSKIKEWLPGSLVHSGGSDDPLHFSYTPTNSVDAAISTDALAYQAQLKGFIQKGLHVPWIFLPVKVVSKVQNRPEAQAALLEGGILRPLVAQTRNKMQKQTLSPGDPAAVTRHREALLSLIQLEADNLSKKGLTGTNAAQNYLKSFISYLTDSNHIPDAALVENFTWTYSKGSGKWPPPALLGGDHLSSNPAIQAGLESFRKVNQSSEARITNEVQLVDNLVFALSTYRQVETDWLAKPTALCSALTNGLSPAMGAVGRSWEAIQVASNSPAGPLTGISSRYRALERAAKGASAEAFRDVTAGLSEGEKTTGIIYEIQERVRTFGAEAAKSVTAHYEPRKKTAEDLDATCLVLLTNNPVPVFQIRWSLYNAACAIESTPARPDSSVVGDGWQRYHKLKATVDQFRTNLAAYNGPLAGPATNACIRVAGNAQQKLEREFMDGYTNLVSRKLSDLPRQSSWTMTDITNARVWFAKIEKDLGAKEVLGRDQQEKLASVPGDAAESKKNVLAAINKGIIGTIGFPVARAAKNEMTWQDLKNLKFLLEGLRSEMEDPVWRSDASGAQAALGKSRDRYAKVVSSLGKDDGTPAEWELFFVPPDSSQAADLAVISFFRQAQAAIGTTASGWMELPDKSAPTSLGKGTVDQSLRLAFRKLEGDKESITPLNVALWGFPRAICGATPERSPDGLKWRFRVPLEHPETKQKGNVTFEVRVQQPLPKFDEEWPQ